MKYTTHGKFTALAEITRSNDGSFLRVDGGKQVTFIEKWENATVKPDEVIKKHFKNFHAALGMLTGKKNGITVIDFDSKDNDLFLALYTESPTFCVETEKGYHLYYQYSADPMFTTRSRVFTGEVDVRNDGGLIFCPPTPNYSVYGDHDIEPITENTLAILRENYIPPKGKTLGSLTTTQTRNDTLFRYGCKWINECDEKETWLKMIRANNAFTKGKLQEKELETIYQQVLKYKPVDGGELSSLAGIPFLKRETKDNGEVISKCMTNVFLLLTHHADFKGRFRFDSFAHQKQVRFDAGWKRLDDIITAEIHSQVQSIHPAFHSTGLDFVEEAIGLACNECTVDSAQEWLTSLTWDGTPRLEAFIALAFGQEDNRYHSIVGKHFFIGMAARIMKPGCHHRSVLILQGEQNTGKSLALRAIAGDNWILEDAPLAIESLSFQMSLWGKLIVEFSEGTILNRADASKLKGLISNPVDTVVEKWAKHPTDIKRRCVFTMTTNKEHFLMDDTGNTRFFPVRTRKVSLEFIKENREQLFAEARVLFENGEKWWSDSEEDVKLFADEQKKRLLQNPMEEKVFDYLVADYNKQKTFTGFRLHEILDGVFGYKKVSKADETMVISVLKSSGFVNVQKRDGEKKGRFWVKKEFVDSEKTEESASE